MKRILFLLLLTVSVYGQNPSRFAKIQITSNANSGTATKVNVQEANGEVNTQAINTGFNKNFGLNSGDVVGANTLLNQYSTTPIDWTATAFSSGQVVFYAGKQWIAISNTVSGDVPAVSAKWVDLTFEGLYNKPSSGVWGSITGTLSAQTDLQAALDAKANLAGPQTFTGVHNFPTATAGTNTTQVATTAFVLANATNIPQLESNGTDLTVWNNGKGNISTNTSFGESSLKLNSTGSSNTSIGQGALSNNTTGSNNTSIGSNSLLSNNGNNNTSIGVNALVSNTSGASNTALGMSALSINTTGGQNVAIGFNAGNVTAFNNINNSLFLGYNALPLLNGQTNEIVIGHNATGAGSNTATLGNTSITSTILRGTVSGGSFVKNSAPTTNLLLAGGGDIAQSTFFVAPTGLTTNFLPKWNGSAFGNSIVSEVSSNLVVNSGASDKGIKILSSLSGSFFTGGLEMHRDNTLAGVKLEPIRNAALGGIGLNILVTQDNSAEISGTYSPALTILPSKRFLFNSSDNGVDDAQFNGSVSISTFMYLIPSSTPASPREGTVYYDSTTKKLRCWNGTTWNDLF